MSNVIGIGLGRTGTKSLCKALEQWYTVQHCPPTLDAMRAVEATAEGCCTRYWTEFPFDTTKFILTIRNPLPWVASCKKAIDHYDWRRLEGTGWFEAMRLNRFYRYGYFAKSSTDGDIDNKLLRHYFRHNGEVIRLLANYPDNLLIVDVTAGQGWETLCPFLGKDIPDTPFPGEHDV